LGIHPVLEEATKALSIESDVPFIRAAADFSERTLDGASKTLTKAFPPSADLHLDVVVLGSVARREASEASDFDFLVIAHGLPANVTATRDLLIVAFDMQEKSQMDAPNPGGPFGSVISAPELTEKVGLQEDTNFNHTRRILLLEEKRVRSTSRSSTKSCWMRSSVDIYLITKRQRWVSQDSS
jgi:hypothetical protein